MSMWELDNGRTMNLLTPAQLKETPTGTVLLCIDGTEVVVGQDDIDDDTRGGYTAFGIEHHVGWTELGRLADEAHALQGGAV